MVKFYLDIKNLSSVWGSIFFFYGIYEYFNCLVFLVIVFLLKGKVVKCFYGN